MISENEPEGGHAGADCQFYGESGGVAGAGRAAAGAGAGGAGALAGLQGGAGQGTGGGQAAPQVELRMKTFVVLCLRENPLGTSLRNKETKQNIAFVFPRIV